MLLKVEVVLEAVRGFAKAFGIDPMRIRMERQKEIKREPTAGEEIELLQDEVKKLRLVSSENGNGKPFVSKVIEERALVSHVEDGWEIIRELSNGRFLIKRSNHTNPSHQNNPTR
jgi:hypothetical protein